MEVTCSGCNTKLNIPDDKVPMDQTVRINCPRCKNKITIEPQNIDNVTRVEAQTDDDSLEYYDESKLALVMADDSICSKVREAVEEKGYRFVTSPNTRDTLQKLRFNHFDLIGTC